MGSSDGVAFIAIVTFVIFYVCFKICCFSNYFKDETDEESAGQTASNQQNQQPARPYVITTRLTGYQPTHSNQTHPAKTAGSPYIPQMPTAPQPESPLNIPQGPTAPYPERNFSEELDLPPSFGEAMQLISQQNQQKK